MNRNDWKFIATCLLTIFLVAVRECRPAPGQEQPKRLQVLQVKPQEEQEPVNRWAVVIGVAAYQFPGVPSLQFAVNDAEAMAAALQARCGFPKDHIRLLTNKQATLRNIRHTLGTWLVQVAKPGDIVVVYFSGHGTPDLDPNVAEGGIRTYMVCYDTNPAELAETAYALDELGVALARVRSEQTLVLLDSCYSGAAPQAGSIGTLRTFHHAGVQAVGKLSGGPVQALAGSGRGRFVLTACSPDEESWEYPKLHHGLFTHFLLRGLAGEAKDRNGQITTLTLSHYLFDSMKRPEPGFEPQHPTGSSSLTAEFTLSAAAAGSTQGNGTLRLHSSPLGASVIIDQQPAGKTPLQRQLPAGSHQILVYKENYLPSLLDVVVSAGRTDYESCILQFRENTGNLFLSLHTPVQAQVKIDGNARGAFSESGSLFLKNLEARPHTLRIEAEGYVPIEEEVDVPAGNIALWQGALQKQIAGKRAPEPKDIVPGLRAQGKGYVWEADGAEMVFVSEGEFLMGDNAAADTSPQQRVTLPAFWIDRTEVTNAQFAHFVEATHYQPQGSWKDPGLERATCPAVSVTLEDARRYARWAGKAIPTEAEWEKAARGTEGYRYPYGNTYVPSNQITHVFASLGEPVKVGTIPEGASPYGALDMLGNAAEWCDTIYDAYPGAVKSNPAYGRRQYVIRGGSYLTVPETDNLTVASRSHLLPEIGQADVGFRCVVRVK